jgi:hypothetical protein
MLRLGLALGAGLAAVLLSQVVRSGPDAPASHLYLVLQEPITQADARLLAEGWMPTPDRQTLPFERKLAGNHLASLSACSGTGMGFCRYDYQRGSHRLAVVTVPGADGNGIVHNTFELE